MTITNPTSGQIATATATTAVFTTATTLAAGTPTTGDLVVGVLGRSADDGAVTTPTDWLPFVEATGTATVKGTAGIYYRVITGGEAPTYTWNFASSSRKMVFLAFHESAAGRVWTTDQSGTYAGSNTAGTSIGSVTQTGTLADAEEVAVASLVLAANTGTIAPTASGLTVVFGGNVTQIMAATITAATTALNPTWAWATSRAKAAGVIGTFRSVPVSSGNMLLVL